MRGAWRAVVSAGRLAGAVLAGVVSMRVFGPGVLSLVVPAFAPAVALAATPRLPGASPTAEVSPAIVPASEPAPATVVPSPPFDPASAAEPDAACPPDPKPLTNDDVAAGMRDARDGGFLWKATKDGHSTYLYGTIHIAQRAWMFPGPKVLAAIRASDGISLELDPSDPDIAARLQRAIAMRPGVPTLPPALEARLRAQIVAACLSPDALSGLRPEMRAVTVEVMAARALGLQPAYGVDVFLSGLGHGMRKTVRSLETPESQAALLVSDDPRETARSVAAILDELEAGNGSRILARLAGDWRQGNLADLGAYGDWCDCMTTPEQRADFVKLVDDRNPLMADSVVKLHDEGFSLFVAVGSLHMVGPRGLPALLQARGFDVQHVDFGETGDANPAPNPGREGVGSSTTPD